MAKNNFGRQLLGKTEPSKLIQVSIGAFLSFFVYTGAVFTFEPIAASLVGSRSVFLYAEDEDMGAAMDSARWEQARRDQAAQSAAANAQAEAQRRALQERTAREQSQFNRDTSSWRRTGSDGSTWAKNGSGVWVCIKDCKPTSKPPPSIK